MCRLFGPAKACVTTPPTLSGTWKPTQCHAHTDGDTFRCTDRKKIRIHGIDAPELDTHEGPASKVLLTRILDGQVIDHEQGYAWFVPVAVDEDITQDEAAAHLQKMGYENVQQLPHTGGMYTFEATQDGQEISVFVDKETGEIHELGQAIHN